MHAIYMIARHWLLAVKNKYCGACNKEWISMVIHSCPLYISPTRYLHYGGQWKMEVPTRYYQRMLFNYGLVHTSSYLDKLWGKFKSLQSYILSILWINICRTSLWNGRCKKQCGLSITEKCPQWAYKPMVQCQKRSRTILFAMLPCTHKLLWSSFEAYYCQEKKSKWFL